MEGEELTPLHPNHVKALRLAAILAAIPPFIATLVIELAHVLPVPRGLALVPVLALLVWFVIRMPLRRHAARGYQMGADRLRVVRGLLWRKDTVVPFGRVQHIDVERGPIERYYGLATLVLHTAGTHNASVPLPGLAEADALEMREAIREKIRRDTL
ncbi:MAG TPA: PH domain-containing protein [Croceibacterium sp.]|nr:PH domain-containing protein [Croceibacterium sp.]